MSTFSNKDSDRNKKKKKKNSYKDSIVKLCLMIKTLKISSIINSTKRTTMMMTEWIIILIKLHKFILPHRYIRRLLLFNRVSIRGLIRNTLGHRSCLTRILSTCQR